MNPEKPTLAYDGDCGFCLYWIGRWRHRTHGRVEFVPYQEPHPHLHRVPKEQLEEAIHFFEPDGRISRGAEAVFRTLALGDGLLSKLPLALYWKLPGFRPVSEAIYRIVARNRPFFSFWSRLLWGRHYEPPQFYLTRWLFLRLLGMIYFVAFVSLWTQLSGLIGENGIAPAQPFLENQRVVHAGDAFRMHPTLCWMSASDGFLHFLCGAGAVLSVLLVVGLTPVPVLILLWTFYLSLVGVGQDFLRFQWDALLLETGFLAIFLAPLQVLPNYYREGPPSRLVIWLFRLLVFKLMFLSGLVKLTSGDPTWLNLSALEFHYETQPLPTVFGWLAHQLPAWFQKLSVALMFVIELGAPFLIFGPRKARYAAAAALVFLQLLILATGNYCFFNLLSILLCLLLLDDTVLSKARREILVEKLSKLRFGSREIAGRGWPRGILVPVAAVWLFMSVIAFSLGFKSRPQWPALFVRIHDWIGPYHISNHYGLFRVMTTRRYEIVIEGSNNGVDWLAYEFKYKPGELTRAPRWVQPHQPRLDWQMWFAPLSGPEYNPWFFGFCLRLLQGSSEPLDLLEKNPFPEKPPRWIRAVVYEYHFTDFSTLRETGRWWRRDLRGAYCRILWLDGNRLRMM
jgi:predicted DCC family thiol-disulfide oxidoreductase YuxK